MLGLALARHSVHFMVLKFSKKELWWLFGVFTPVISGPGKQVIIPSLPQPTPGEEVCKGSDTQHRRPSFSP